LENSWSENSPERSEHATGVEPAGDHQWWAVFFDFLFFQYYYTSAWHYMTFGISLGASGKQHNFKI